MGGSGELLVANCEFQERNKVQSQNPKPSDRKTGNNPHQSQVVVCVIDQHVFEPLMRNQVQIKICFINFDSHEISEQVKGFQHFRPQI